MLCIDSLKRGIFKLKSGDIIHGSCFTQKYSTFNKLVMRSLHNILFCVFLINRFCRGRGTRKDVSSMVRTLVNCCFFVNEWLRCPGTSVMDEPRNCLSFSIWCPGDQIKARNDQESSYKAVSTHKQKKKYKVSFLLAPAIYHPKFRTIFYSKI